MKTFIYSMGVLFSINSANAMNMPNYPTFPNNNGMNHQANRESFPPHRMNHQANRESFPPYRMNHHANMESFPPYRMNHHANMESFPPHQILEMLKRQYQEVADSIDDELNRSDMPSQNRLNQLLDEQSNIERQIKHLKEAEDQRISDLIKNHLSRPIPPGNPNRFYQASMPPHRMNHQVHMGSMPYASMPYNASMPSYEGEKAMREKEMRKKMLNHHRFDNLNVVTTK